MQNSEANAQQNEWKRRKLKNQNKTFSAGFRHSLFFCFFALLFLAWWKCATFLSVPIEWIFWNYVEIAHSQTLTFRVHTWLSDCWWCAFFSLNFFFISFSVPFLLLYQRKYQDVAKMSKTRNSVLCSNIVFSIFALPSFVLWFRITCFDTIFFALHLFVHLMTSCVTCVCVVDFSFDNDITKTSTVAMYVCMPVHTSFLFIWI